MKRILMLFVLVAMGLGTMGADGCGRGNDEEAAEPTSIEAEDDMGEPTFEDADEPMDEGGMEEDTMEDEPTEHDH